MNDGGLTEAQRAQLLARFRAGIGSRVPPRREPTDEQWAAYAEDVNGDREWAESALALGCPWCKGAGPFGHECAERDHWLDIEDSEFDDDSPTS